MRPASIHHSSNRNHPKAPSTTHRIMRIFLPMFILFWVFLFTYGKEAVDNNKLRGSATVTTEKNLLSKLKENTRNNNNNNYNKNDRDNTNDKNKRLKEDIAQLETKEKRRKIVIPTHAVIVAGHAVVRLNKMSSADRADSSWYLLPYQLGQGFPSIITSHIKKGINVITKDDASLLIFSGGQTRRDTGPISEAASYYFFAQEKKYINDKNKIKIYLEEYARDSYENLLFSICRFYEVVGRYPSKVSVIGFDFKDHRFTSLHRMAIGYPLSKFNYIGLKPSINTNFLYSNAKNGELVASAQFTNDMYGCTNTELIKKRTVRNPFIRTVPYILSCPELKNLLLWCGSGLYGEMNKLPWTEGFISTNDNNNNNNSALISN